MSDSDTRRAYARRSDEYIAALGTVEAMNVHDRLLIAQWGASVEGPALDAGSGPGHWTDFLASAGLDIRGVDLTPEFVRSARERIPHRRFEVGDLRRLPVLDAELGGVLSWYSIIHTPPEEARALLAEFARVVRPGGTLLIGVFLGAQGEAFDHAITRAFTWSAEGLSTALELAGMGVREVHIRDAVGARPHLAIVAERTSGS